MSDKLQGLKTKWLGKAFLALDETGSTNEYLKSRASGLPNGFAVTANRQTSGKGRLGRVWQTGAESLALSFLLHDVDPSSISAISPAVGLAVYNALVPFCESGLALKWSNDILYNGKKLCGILCESRILGDNAFAVVGIGLNIAQTQDDFDRLGLVYATSLKLATGKTVGIFELSACILNNFEPIFEDFIKSGFAEIREEYKKNCINLGRDMLVIRSGEEVICKAIDIDNTGALICQNSGEIFTVNAGDASVRGIYGYLQEEINNA